MAAVTTTADTTCSHYVVSRPINTTSPTVLKHNMSLTTPCNCAITAMSSFQHQPQPRCCLRTYLTRSLDVPPVIYGMGTTNGWYLALKSSPCAVDMTTPVHACFELVFLTMGISTFITQVCLAPLATCARRLQERQPTAGVTTAIWAEHGLIFRAHERHNGGRGDSRAHTWPHCALFVVCPAMHIILSTDSSIGVRNTTTSRHPEPAAITFLSRHNVREPFCS